MEWDYPLHAFFDERRADMDAFTGKEQNRSNVVPMVCQFLLSQKEPANLGKRIQQIYLGKMRKTRYDKNNTLFFGR